MGRGGLAVARGAACFLRNKMDALSHDAPGGGGGATVEWAERPWGRGTGANPRLQTQTCVDPPPSQVSPRCIVGRKLYKMLKLSSYVITLTDLYKHVITPEGLFTCDVLLRSHHFI